jgi:hypothetical protein
MSLEKAKLFVLENLSECCQELVEMDETAVLRDGKIRQAASMMKEIPACERLKIAMSTVSHEAVLFCASANI